ncbi:ABC transporter ATP-binding protein/permease [Marinilongibacter aquaticus]|uniref:ABC transporter ATP-binding protein n=1 Tax=Marinilongibacter aquaticus TaxID=2975157 RepID=UPI0021BD09C8|nr:ABC transporter ATP-binding protein [Marinilongibacter aquaticus]UBM57875.1 ABC transporter ATP-binding protein/permease [Marinilongibacter aquaticus]
MKTYFKLLSFAGKLRNFIIPFVFTSLVSGVFGAGVLYLVKPMLEVLFDQVGPDALNKMLVRPEGYNAMDWFNHYFALNLQEGGKMQGLKFVCSTLIVSIVIGNVFRYLGNRLLEGFKVNMVANLRQAIFDRALQLELSYFTNERKGDLISRITTDVQEVENSIGNTFSAGIKDTILLLSYLFLLFYTSVKLTLFALIVIPITGGFLGIITKKLRHNAHQGQNRLANIISLMDETFGGMRVVKAFVAEHFIGGKFKEENQGYKRSIFSYAARRELASPFSEVVGVSMVAGILLYGGTLVLGENAAMEASAFLAYIAIFSQVVVPAKSITQSFSNSQRGIVSGERILSVLERESNIVDKPDAVEISSFEKEIEFKHVGFSYMSDMPVLRDINFELKKGKSVALVGPSGGGKSTISDLVPRFYEPNEGEIRIDGYRLDEVTQRSLRKLMGIVTQEPVLFNDTIYNNITFGIEASEEEVIRAAKIANAHTFIEQQSEGYQTVIGDRGSKLSGGQRQRISIARAVLQNPPILILDEATSALDTESERLVQDALTHLMDNRTTLVIAHRLSTIQQADEILVIQDGKIKERGNHESLYANEKGLYRKLVEMQEM